MADPFTTYKTVDGKYFMSILNGADGIGAPYYLLGPSVNNVKTCAPVSIGTFITPASLISSENYPTTIPSHISTLPSSLSGTPTKISDSDYGFGVPATLTIAEINDKTQSLAFLIRHTISGSNHIITLYIGYYRASYIGAKVGSWQVGPSWYYLYEGPADDLMEFTTKLATPGIFCTYPNGVNWTFAAYNIPVANANDLPGISTFNASWLFTQSPLWGTGEYTPVDEPDNPYEPLEPSGPGGGGGGFTSESDQITIPSQPTLTSAGTGFTRIYNPTLQQVKDLADYLWTDETVIDTIWNHIKQFFENPMEAMIAFNLVPVPIPDGGSVPFKIMYIETGVNMNLALTQFVDVNCGTVQMSKYYGSALDFSPYTKVSLFLPFIGTVSLNTDEVMGRTVAVAYRIDIVSGNCVAYVMVDGNALYQYSGHCAINIPFSAADFSNYMSACISIAKLGATLLTGAAGALSDAPMSANGEISEGSNPILGSIADGVSNTVGAVMSSKPHIEHSGSFSGNSGYLGVRRPYLIIQRPRACMPQNYGRYNGYPCMMNLKLSNLSGYTKVQQIHLENVKATSKEISEILQFLKGGVVI